MGGNDKVVALNPLAQMAEKGERPTYEQLERLYDTCFESLEESVAECNTLRGVVTGQARANSALGEKDADRDAMVQAQIGDHNSTVQEMGAEINRLRAVCTKHGINPDEE